MEVEDKIDGFTRVSKVLDYFHEPELVDWMVEKGREARKLSKQAMKIGTELDGSVKEFVATGIYGKVKTVEANSCLDGFKRWYDDYKPVLTVGVRIFDKDLMVTGEPDLYWEDRVIDLKCASSIRPKYWIQTGIYDLIGKNSMKTGILRLHKHLADYEYKVHNGEEVMRDADCFMSLLSAYNYLTVPTGDNQQGDRHGNYITDNKE